MPSGSSAAFWKKKEEEKKKKEKCGLFVFFPLKSQKLTFFLDCRRGFGFVRFADLAALRLLVLPWRQKNEEESPHLFPSILLFVEVWELHYSGAAAAAAAATQQGTEL